MKTLFTVTALVICGAAAAEAENKIRSEKAPAGTLGSYLQPITDGQGTLRINSFGRADYFSEGPVNHLFESLQFVSINNGPMEEVAEPDWVLINNLEISGGRGFSSVGKEKILRIDITNVIRDRGNGLVTWFATVTFTNLLNDDMNLCYYPYVDYDLFDASENDLAAFAASDPDLGIPAIRVSKQGWPEVFLFANLDNLSMDYRIGEYPTVLDVLSNAQSCVDLGGFVTPFGPGDFSSALKFPLVIAPGKSATVNLRMGRLR
jgi:hypothetical protein